MRECGYTYRECEAEGWMLPVIHAEVDYRSPARYDDLLEVNDNVVYVYDYEGNLVDAMLIRMPEGYNTFEIEAVSFLGDRMILTFNENLADEDNTLMIGVWGQSSTSLE